MSISDNNLSDAARKALYKQLINHASGTNSFSYKVDANGVYNFEIYDVAGNFETVSVTVSEIIN